MNQEAKNRGDFLWLAGMLFLVILFQLTYGTMQGRSLALAQTANDPSLVEEIVTYDGVERGVLVFVPHPLPPNGVPVVFMLHGGSSSPRKVMETTTNGQWNEIAFREKFIVVYPGGVHGAWNDCRHEAEDQSSNADDVGFFLYLLEWLGARYPINFEQLYVAGYDNGGMMALRIAREVPGVVRGVFSNGGPLAAESECFPPQQAVSVMFLAATADPLVPYIGGVPGLAGEKSDRVLSATETVAIWLNWLGLHGDAAVSQIPDRVRQDGSTLTIYRYSGGDASFWFVKVQGGGHAWPGAEPYSLMEQQSNGLRNQDIEGAELAWFFFDSLSD
jgi:polyhydroxybutyrate depolymerase